MADIRCPNCGKNNPDLLDVCQFCLTPLKPESILHIGERPTKKNTGELEPILPDWLKDVRQQARTSAEEDASKSASLPASRREEPPDLLAGLASQASKGDEEEVPDWLASLNPTAEPKPQDASSQAPAAETDFFSQFDKSPSDSAPGESPAPADKDELSAWFAQAAEQPDEIVELDSHAEGMQRGWESGLDSPVSTSKEQAHQEEEDLGWLRSLEESAKQTGDLKAPKLNTDWMSDLGTPATPSQPASPQEDLSWLDRLGSIEEPSQQPFEQPPAPQEDLSWLNQLGGIQPSQPSEAPKAKPSVPEDLSWLDDLGAAPEAAQPFDAALDKPVPPKPFVSEEDQKWLSSLGGEPEAPQPFTEPVSDLPAESISNEDLSWLNNLGGDKEASAATPFAEAEDSPEAAQEGNEPQPDWLKSAEEMPSMPAPGDVSMDWFKQKEPPLEGERVPPAEAPQPAPFADIFSTPSEGSSLSSQEVDSLFSAEMPDWLSRPEPGIEEQASPQPALPPENVESLAPVDLPSWVQAMRPVEALISEAAPSTEDQPEEKEGPLAGLRGVIPGSSLGSSIRPKAVSLKLQVTDEQQSSAALLEQVLGTETSPRALIDASFIASQHALRWVLAGLLLVVLGAVIGLRSQRIPISPSLPIAASNVSNAVMSIPAGANVLVVIDYEPALVGEMEAIGGPLLEQMVRLGHPNLSFLSTSPNGAALVERLLASVKINTPDGFGYQAGSQYSNLGFLPGGSAGVLGFVQRPGEVMPGAGLGAFSEYAAVVVMTDHAESGRVWVEQLHAQRGIQGNPALTSQPLLVVASAQAGPLLQPYVSSQQVTGMISGLSEAARYEAANNGQSGMTRSYWDAFGVGLAMSIAAIIIGSLWSLYTGIRARRTEAEQG